METLDKFEIPVISFDYSGQKMLLTSPKQLSEFREIVQLSCQKLKICLLIRFGMSNVEFINYCMKYISDIDENIRGPTALFLDYYNKNGGYYRNSQFLYGRASQFR